MKQIIVLGFIFQMLVCDIWAKEDKQELVKWLSFEEASKEMSKNTSKMMLIDVYTVWCGPCRVMSERTLNHPEVAKIINTHFYPVKFNAEGNLPIHFLGQSYSNKDYKEELANSRNGVHSFTYYAAQTNRGIAYPTITFLNYNGTEKHPVQGVMDAKEFAFLLYYVSEGHYKKNIDFQDFKKQNKEKINF